MTSMAPVTWPEGKRFAFTIVDDTDAATLENVCPIYDVLAELGFKTTKTVWPLDPIKTAPLGGKTLQDADWRRWIHELRRSGFEIAFHGVTDHDSDRSRTIEALAFWERELGEPPRLYASHAGQQEAMYWGPRRFSGATRLAYGLLNRALGRDTRFYGEVPESAYYWGDLCGAKIDYVRNFTFRGINTLAADPLMPWHDPQKPDVRYWFSSSNGAVGRDFCELLSERNQDRLAEEGGACVVYTHFAYDFIHDGTLRKDFVALMRRLSTLGGWYAPASSVLDHLRARPSWKPDITSLELERLQLRWMIDNLRTPRAGKYWRMLRSRLA
jgi:hypothetical protein